MFTIEIPGVEIGELVSDRNVIDETIDDSVETFQEGEDVEPCISLNSLNGNTSIHTMRVVGYVGKKPLHILIDSGSTHYFIDEYVVDKLKLCKDLIMPYSVTIADGNQLHCKAVCRDFSWRLQEVVFESDV